MLARDHNVNQFILAGGFARSSPLALALYKADVEMIRFLASAGADVNEPHQMEFSPLSIAVLIGFPLDKDSDLDPLIHATHKTSPRPVSTLAAS